MSSQNKKAVSFYQLSYDGAKKEYYTGSCNGSDEFGCVQISKPVKQKLQKIKIIAINTKIIPVRKAHLEIDHHNVLS
jgi:hypothetical protein